MTLHVDEAALLAAIRADPEDDTPRLVYADWLEETSELANVLRAEFIRVQCRQEAAGHQAVPPGREQELWTAWRAKVDLPARIDLRHFRRGFLRYRRWEACEFLRCGETVRRCSASDRLGLFSATGLGDELARCPALTGWEVLDLTSSGLYSEGVEAVLKSEHIAGLRELYAGHLGLAGVLAVSRSPQLAGLRVLDLQWNTVGSEGVVALADSRYLANLRVLVLRSTGVGPRSIPALTSHCRFTDLEELDLSANRSAFAESRLTERHLATPSKPPRLRRLDLRENGINEWDCRKLEAHFGRGVCLFDNDERT